MSGAAGTATTRDAGTAPTVEAASAAAPAGGGPGWSDRLVAPAVVPVRAE